MAKSKVESKKEHKYRAILQAAEDLMAANGIQTLNMDNVAKQAGIAKGTLYLYFKSKEDVIGALALKARKQLLETFKQEIANRELAQDQLAGIIRANYLFLQQNQLYYDLVSFYEVSERDTETEEMQQVIREIIELIVSIIARGVTKAELSASVNPLVLAFSMWGMTVGVMQLIKAKGDVIAQHDALSEAKILQSFIDSFLDGIKK